jgi:hypothetical protein
MNNTFSRAKYIGRISSAGGSLQIKDSLNAADPIDIYQYRVRPGSAFTARSSFNPRGGSFDLSIYYKDPQTGKTTAFSGSTIRIEGNDTINIATPSVSRTVTFYLKLSKPRGAVDYEFELQAVK